MHNLAKQTKFQAKTTFTTGETLGLAKWIIDDTCLVVLYNQKIKLFLVHFLSVSISITDFPRVYCIMLLFTPLLTHAPDPIQIGGH